MNFIYQEKDCLSAEKCDKIIELFDELKQYQRPGLTSDGVDENFKKSTDLQINIDGCRCFENLEFKNLMEDVLVSLKNGLQSYKDEYTIDGMGINTVLHWGIERNFNIQRYLPTEGYYVWHIENSGVHNCQRILAWMIYLNDVNDGGGTEFLFQNLTTRAEQGKLVIWPADWTHYHRGEVSNSETKYIVTGWFRYL